MRRALALLALLLAAAALANAAAAHAKLRNKPKLSKQERIDAARARKAERHEEKHELEQLTRASKQQWSRLKKAHNTTLTSKQWHAMLKAQKQQLLQHHVALRHAQAVAAVADAGVASRTVSLIALADARPALVREAVARANAEQYPWVEVVVVDDSAGCAAASYIDVDEADGWSFVSRDADSFGFTVQRDALAHDGSFRRVRYMCSTRRLTTGEKRNIGLAAAGGKYVAFADDSVLYEHQRLSKQLAYLQRHHLDFTVLTLDLMASIDGSGGAPPRLYQAAGPELPLHYATMLFDRFAVLACNHSDVDGAGAPPRPVSFHHTWDKTFGEAAQFAIDAVDRCGASLDVVQEEVVAPPPPPPASSRSKKNKFWRLADGNAVAKRSVEAAAAAAGGAADVEVDLSAPPRWVYVTDKPIDPAATPHFGLRELVHDDEWPDGDWCSRDTLQALANDWLHRDDTPPRVL